MNCSNCQTEFNSNFCPNCGQRAYTRIDKYYIVNELQSTVLHVNKGFLFTIKNLLLRPGKTAREFVAGQRMYHYKPIMLVLVLTAISSVIEYKFIGLNDALIQSASDAGVSSNFMTNLLNFIAQYSGPVMLAMLPFYALFSKLAFRKWGYNYYEHIVLNAFLLSLLLIVQTLFLDPVMFFKRSDPHFVSSVASNSQYLLLPILSVIFFKGVFPDKSWGKIILRILRLLLLVAAGFTLFLVFVFLLGLLTAYIAGGTEFLHYFKPQQ